MDIRSRVGSEGSEQGLLSMAFHPQYGQNRRFYVNYTDTMATRASSSSARTAGRRGRHGSRAAVREPAVLEPQRRATPVRARREALRRHGGRRERGRPAEPRPDTGLTPRQAAADESPRGRLGGGRLRPAQPLALLVRSEDRRSLHRRRRPERVRGDRLPAERRATRELRLGTIRGEQLVRDRHRSDPPSPLVFPIFEYSHNEGCSVTGGYVYRGTACPRATGRYFFGDYCSGNVWSLRVVDGKASGVRRESFDVAGLTSLGEGARGALYFVAQEGIIYRLAR